MSLVLGQRMVRLDDGMKGVVELEQIGAGAVLRIAYYDRGERRVASQREVWNPEQEPPALLRAEEKLQIALAADRKLKAIEKHEPDRFWEPLSGEPHDPGLVMAILAYLSQR